MEITASPRAWSRPWKGERMWPKLRALTMILTLRSDAAISLRIGTVRSVEALSMKMCS